MAIDQHMLDDIRATPLLSRCGQACDVAIPFSAAQVSSWAGALAVYDETWSTLKDRRYQDLSLLLSQIDRQRFNSTWSKTVAKAKAGLTEALQGKLNADQVTDKVAKYIKADLLGSLIEQSYSIPDPGFPSFYRSLYILYRAGHFPCGWTGGVFPEGHLLYF